MIGTSIATAGSKWAASGSRTRAPKHHSLRCGHIIQNSPRPMNLSPILARIIHMEAIMKNELVEKVRNVLSNFTVSFGAPVYLGQVLSSDELEGMAKAAIAAIPQAGDAAELVERLEKKAKYTDATFSNSSLGQLYREAATTIRT